jgi:hypothetical protein
MLTPWVGLGPNTLKVRTLLTGLNEPPLSPKIDTIPLAMTVKNHF